MRVLICGQREYTNRETVRTVLETFNPETTVIIHGNCVGADMLADAEAKKLGMKVEPYPIDELDWRRYGKGAGPVRNRRMLVEGKPDLVIGFFVKGGRSFSRGTKNMLVQAEKAGVQCITVEDS